MATLPYLEPDIVDLGALGPGDVDSGRGCDCTTNLNARGTTISSVGTPVITRKDGQALTASDLTIPSTSVPSDGLSFGWKAVAGSNLTTYIIDFPLSLANGDLLHRFFSLVVGQIG